MTAAIMTRGAARMTVAAPHTGASAVHRQLGDLLARMAREADSRIPAERRARRTLQEMAPGYERQPVLTLYRPVMADDACPLCGSWNCDPNNCPPSSVAPAPATANTGMQCDVCGGTFGAAPAPTNAHAGGTAVTAWTCDACNALGI
ncbi:hypothetical protein ACPZ13_00680 [Streptomyces sp. IPPR8]|uniref:hypothetical protein n=1 Tax=Streptomyces sp. IPPR8 TaxID=3417301 RepID=UPI003D686049